MDKVNKTELSNIKDQFTEIEKKLVDVQRAFNKDSYFNQQDTQKILSVLQYFKEH